MRPRARTGAALLARGRVPPGVLPVLSTLTPHRLAPPLTSPLPAKAAHPESKAAGGDAAATADGHSAPQPAPAQPTQKNVFQRAKEMKM